MNVHQEIRDLKKAVMDLKDFVTQNLKISVPNQKPKTQKPKDAPKRVTKSNNKDSNNLRKTDNRRKKQEPQRSNTTNNYKTQLREWDKLQQNPQIQNNQVRLRQQSLPRIEKHVWEKCMAYSLHIFKLIQNNAHLETWKNGTPKHLENQLDQFLRQLNVPLSRDSYTNLMLTASVNSINYNCNWKL